MVMAVFTLPAFNLVFKIIKDSFGAPKNHRRRSWTSTTSSSSATGWVAWPTRRSSSTSNSQALLPRELLAYLVRVAGRPCG